MKAPACASKLGSLTVLCLFCGLLQNCTYLFSSNGDMSTPAFHENAVPGTLLVYMWADGSGEVVEVMGMPDSEAADDEMKLRYLVSEQIVGRILN